MKYFVVVVLLFTLMVPKLEGIYAQSRYKSRFAFITQNYDYERQSETTSLFVFDPENPESNPIQIDLDTPGTLPGLANAYLSPDNRHFALIFQEEGTNWIRIYDLSGTNWQDVSPVKLTRVEDFRFKERFQKWSPDGRFFSFNAWGDKSSPDTYIYDLNTGALINLTNDEDWQFSFDWSSNSDKLAIYSAPDESSIDVQISIYDIASQSKLMSVPFTRPAGAYVGRSVCNLDWSPNDHYLVFIQNCDGRGFAANIPRNVYLIDLQKNNIAEISPTGIEEGNSQDILDEIPQWLADNTLLTIWYSEKQPLYGVIFDPQTHTGKASENNLQNWKANPENPNLGITLSQANGVTSIIVRSQTESYIERQIDNFRVETEPEWSLDGQFIAYQMSNQECSLCLSGFSLLDATTLQTIGEYGLPEPSTINLPLGWIDFGE